MTTPTTVQIKLQLRADTAANWTAVNPVLLANEIALETDTKKVKINTTGSTQSWNVLSYFPFVVSGGTVLDNLTIGSTGTLLFEGSTDDGFETTLAVADPTADRVITLPNQSGTVIVSGNASIVNADIAANAEIAVSKLANGTANQVLVTDGTDVSWSDNLTLAGDLTVNGTTTTINTQDLLVEDKNIIIGNVDTPSDVTADGGGITLKGTTDKTINWVDSTDAWTSSERFSVPLGSAASPSLTFTGDPNTGIYSPGADQVAISSSGVGRVFIDAGGNVGIGIASPETAFGGGGGALDVAGPVLARGALNAHQTNAGVLQYNGNETTIRSYGATAGTGAIVFNTGGGGGSGDSEKVRITSDGKVGLGTSSPQRSCHIVASADGYPLRLESTAQPAATIEFLGNTTVTAPYIGAFGDNFAIVTGNTTRLHVASGGNVGVGTTSPGTTLDVNGNIRFNTNTYLSARDSAGTGYVELLKAGANNETVIANNKNAGITFVNTNTSELARVDSSGRLLVGTSTARSNDLFGTSQFQTEGTDAATSSISVIRNSNNAGSGGIALCKTRGSSVGGVTVVQNGDPLGFIDFQGADGTDFARAASIQAEVDGTPGANDMPGRLVFSTTADGASSPTERMRITNGGRLEAWGGSAVNSFNLVTQAAAGTTYYLIFGGHSSSGAGNYGTQSFGVWSNGNVVNTNNSYTAISDIKLKENIVDANSQWDDIKALQVRNYNLKEGQTHRQIGLIAQEVEPISPGLVYESPDRDEDGNDLGTVTKSVNYSVLYMKAVKALQEAMERIEALEAEVAALKAQ